MQNLHCADLDCRCLGLEDNATGWRLYFDLVHLACGVGAGCVQKIFEDCSSNVTDLGSKKLTTAFINPQFCFTKKLIVQGSCETKYHTLCTTQYSLHILHNQQQSHTTTTQYTHSHGHAGLMPAPLAVPNQGHYATTFWSNISA